MAHEYAATARSVGGDLAVVTRAGPLVALSIAAALFPHAAAAGAPSQSRSGSVDVEGDLAAGNYHAVVRFGLPLFGDPAHSPRRAEILGLALDALNFPASAETFRDPLGSRALPESVTTRWQDCDIAGGDAALGALMSAMVLEGARLRQVPAQGWDVYTTEVLGERLLARLDSVARLAVARRVQAGLECKYAKPQ